MRTAAQLAGDVVNYINPLVTETTLAFQAVKVDGHPVIDVASPPTLHIYAYDEREIPFDRGGGVKAEREINCVLQAPLNGEFGLDQAMAWLNEVKELFHDMPEFGGLLWDRNDTASAYDSDFVKEHSLFLSVFRGVFFDFC